MHGQNHIKSSYLLRTDGFFLPELQRPGREADYLLSSDALGSIALSYTRHKPSWLA